MNDKQPEVTFSPLRLCLRLAETAGRHPQSLPGSEDLLKVKGALPLPPEGAQGQHRVDQWISESEEMGSTDTEGPLYTQLHFIHF